MIDITSHVRLSGSSEGYSLTYLPQIYSIFYFSPQELKHFLNKLSRTRRKSCIHGIHGNRVFWSST